MVADPVTRTEILVRRVIEHAPLKAARVLTVRHRVVHDLRVPQRLLLPALPGVPGLGREHMPIALGNEERLIHVRSNLLFGLRGNALARVGKIIERVNILKQMTLLKISHARGRARRVEFMRQRVRSGIKFVTVHALVNADAPEHDRRMAAILQDHLARVLNRLVPPFGGIADMLPAGDLRKYKQSQLVAGIEERVRLRIMRSPHRVHMQLVLQNMRVRALQRI